MLVRCGWRTLQFWVKTWSWMMNSTSMVPMFCLTNPSQTLFLNHESSCEKPFMPLTKCPSVCLEGHCWITLESTAVLNEHDGNGVICEESEVCRYWLWCFKEEEWRFSKNHIYSRWSPAAMVHHTFLTRQVLFIFPSALIPITHNQTSTQQPLVHFVYFETLVRCLVCILFIVFFRL